MRRPPVFGGIIAPFVYEETLAHLVTRWKYQRTPTLTRLLASLWLQQAGDLPAVDLLVPVPLHWTRLLDRGFNQADLLLREIVRGHPQLATVAIDPLKLRRRRATSRQVGQSATLRRRNLAGAFTVIGGCDNLRVAVVDDVVTTGATATAAAGALINAGAAEVHIWCLARTPSPEC